jgi:hypothetical protein
MFSAVFFSPATLSGRQKKLKSVSIEHILSKELQGAIAP